MTRQEYSKWYYRTYGKYKKHKGRTRKSTSYTRKTRTKKITQKQIIASMTPEQQAQYAQAKALLASQKRQEVAKLKEPLNNAIKNLRQSMKGMTPEQKEKIRIQIDTIREQFKIATQSVSDAINTKYKDLLKEQLHTISGK